MEGGDKAPAMWGRGVWLQKMPPLYPENALWQVKEGLESFSLTTWQHAKVDVTTAHTPRHVQGLKGACMLGLDRAVASLWPIGTGQMGSYASGGRTDFNRILLFQFCGGRPCASETQISRDRNWVLTRLQPDSLESG